MVSKPPFLVEITNSTGETLAIQCSFPLPEEDVPVAAEGGPEPGYGETPTTRTAYACPRNTASWMAAKRGNSSRGSLMTDH